MMFIHDPGVLWIQKNPGKSIEDAPTQIAYKRYRQFRAEHGLELVGYPPDQQTESGDLINPNQFRHIDKYKNLHHDVTHGRVHWRELSDVEWKAAQDEMCVSAVSAQTKKARKKASAAVKEAGNKSVQSSRSKSKKRKALTSQDIVPDEHLGEENTPSA